MLRKKLLQIQKNPRQTSLQLKSKLLQLINDRVVPATIFKTFYMRNDLPVVVDFEGASRKIQWKVEIDMLDYHHYLPIFFEGLREPEEPMKFLADKGTDELIMNGKDKILSVLPQLIIPIKLAMQTKR